jgi:hypothetical protein
VPQLRKQNKDDNKNIIKIVRKEKIEEIKRSTRRILHEKIQRNGHPSNPFKKEKKKPS